MREPLLFFFSFLDNIEESLNSLKRDYWVLKWIMPKKSGMDIKDSYSWHWLVWVELIIDWQSEHVDSCISLVSYPKVLLNLVNLVSQLKGSYRFILNRSRFLIKYHNAIFLCSLCINCEYCGSIPYHQDFGVISTSFPIVY